MIVAMITVGVVQMTIHEVVDVIPVRHSGMPAPWSMAMSLVVTRAGMLRGATLRIRGRHFDPVFVDVPRMRMVQMAIVQVIDVAVVFHREMTAPRSVLMRMVRMSLALVHRISPD
jgi:hypothetical protein